MARKKDGTARRKEPEAMAGGCSPLCSGVELMSFVCPMTNSIFDEPVEADDGYTYSKQAICAYFASYKERGFPIISLKTRQKMRSEKLVPNQAMENAIADYRKEWSEILEELAKARQGTSKTRVQSEADLTNSSESHHEAPKCLAELGTMFLLLDGLRELLAEALDGWQPPQLVVVGQENSGKSSVLERLMMTPLLPRDENADFYKINRTYVRAFLSMYDCAVQRRLCHPGLRFTTPRPKQQREAPTSLQLNLVSTDDLRAYDVSAEMHRIISDEQGTLKGVSSSRIIILHIMNPDVPFLDLVDMPGIVTAPSGDEPKDMARQTTELIKSYMKSENGNNSIYLAVVKATSAPNASVAMQILHEEGLYPKTLGVFTFCDEIGRKHARRLKQWVRTPADGQGAVSLEPWGWVATTNAPPEDKHGNAVVYANNFERLQAQASAEVSVFKEMELSDLLDDGFASNSALVSRLNRMFVDHLKTTWAPKTFQMIALQQSKLDFENAVLGMPPAHKDDNKLEVQKIITQGVENALDMGMQKLVKRYSSSVLQEMKKNIHTVVHKIIHDAFPEAWLQFKSDSLIVSREQEVQIHSWLNEAELNRVSEKKAHIQLELLYRASRDGWQAQAFHSRCDSKGSTVTVIKSTEGYVFGGYADSSWSSEGDYAASPNAFLFALHCPSGAGPVKMPVTDPAHAIYCHPSYGPTFGEGHDIHVPFNVRRHNKFGSKCQIHVSLNGTQGITTSIRSYQLPRGHCAQTFFTGKGSFDAAEVEVFRVVTSQPESQVLQLHVPLESFDEVFERAPDMYAPLLGKNALKHEASFWVQGVQGLFPKDLQDEPEWPSTAARALIDNPPLHISKRFPAVIDSLVDQFKGDLKPAADSLILDEVSSCLKRFSDEVAVGTWHKTSSLSGVEIKIMKADRLEDLKESIVLIFLRHNTAMVKKLAHEHSLIHNLIGQRGLLESCAAQRLEIMSKMLALEQAKEGMFEVFGVHTPKERQAWESQLAEAVEQLVIESNILSAKQTNQIFSFLALAKCQQIAHTKKKAHIQLELLYRASRDGWQAQAFHSRCDSKGSTVTVIKSTEGYVFGGYADSSWSSQANYAASPNAFLFALHCPSSAGPVKMPVTNPAHAIYCCGSNGPAFGKGHDINVGLDGTQHVTTSISSYQLPRGHCAQTFFTGKKRFDAAEVEVFRVTS